MGALQRPISVEGDGDEGVSVLINLRECINNSVGALLKLRPTQEQSGKKLSAKLRAAATSWLR